MHHLPTEREHDETNDADVKDDRPKMEFARTHALSNGEKA